MLSDFIFVGFVVQNWFILNRKSFSKEIYLFLFLQVFNKILGNRLKLFNLLNPFISELLDFQYLSFKFFTINSNVLLYDQRLSQILFKLIFHYLQFSYCRYKKTNKSKYIYIYSLLIGFLYLQ